MLFIELLKISLKSGAARKRKNKKAEAWLKLKQKRVS